MRTFFGLLTAVYQATVINMFTGISTGMISATPRKSHFMDLRIPLPTYNGKTNITTTSDRA